IPPFQHPDRPEREGMILRSGRMLLEHRPNTPEINECADACVGAEHVLSKRRRMCRADPASDRRRKTMLRQRRQFFRQTPARETAQSRLWLAHGKLPRRRNAE